MNPYTRNFYHSMQAGSRRSAREIVPLVLEWIRPRHVIDVGCGIGTWLGVVRECGVQDVLGLDGEYVDKSLLQIPAERFQPVDLIKPPPIERQFDLVLSLEVAEHLPPEGAAAFVEYLTGLGTVVLFSAAIPHQGGDEHVNEQWPDYWASLFRARGFIAVDALRPRFWRNENVEAWYAQNTILYVQHSHPLLEKLRAEEFTGRGEMPLPFVHPRLYQHKQYVAMELQEALAPESRSLKEVLAWLPLLLRKALVSKLQGLRTRSSQPMSATKALAREL